MRSCLNRVLCVWKFFLNLGKDLWLHIAYREVCFIACDKSVQKPSLKSGKLCPFRILLGQCGCSQPRAGDKSSPAQIMR